MPIPSEFNYKSYQTYFKTGISKRGRKETELNEYTKKKNEAIEVINEKYKVKHTELEKAKESLKSIKSDNGKNSK